MVQVPYNGTGWIVAVRSRIRQVFSNETPMVVVGISGSLRKGSYNTACLQAAGELMPDDMVIEIAQLNRIPLYNSDDERAHGFPGPVQELRGQVGRADALLIASPEYNYSVTGALKNAWDWLSRPPQPPISLMPAAIMGAGGRLGTARSQHHFRDMARHNDLRLVQKPEVLISAPWDKFDDRRNLTDERTRDQVKRLVLALRGLTMRIRATRKRVLLVGREASDLTGVTTQLTEVGYQPVTVRDDNSALNLIDPGQFSAVVIDDLVESGSVAALTDHTAHIAPNTAIVVHASSANLIEILEEAIKVDQ